jgi:predicted RNA-binding Zn-ribbon protein involved in translation (DUF1610 family)
MTIIGRCPYCGEHRLRARDLTVRVLIPSDERSCTYACPRCGQGIARQVSHDKSCRLIDEGCRLVFWRWPRELAEPHHGEPIGYGDVHGFCLDLERNDWLSEVAAT